MKLKKIIVFAGLVATLATFLAVWGCKCPTPPPCCNPNPIVTWEASGFSVTPDSMAGATSVTIQSFDANGNPLDTFNVAPKTKQTFKYGPQATRPIQLRFFYNSSNGEVICEDQLQVNDLETNGGPIVSLDIILGLSAPNTNPALSTPPECPTTSQLGDENTGSVTFACATNDWFQIKVTHDEVEHRFGLYVTTESPNKLAFFRSDVYNCLTNPDCEIDEEDGRSIDVELSSSSAICTIAGNLDTGTEEKTITISGPEDCKILVSKK